MTDYDYLPEGPIDTITVTAPGSTQRLRLDYAVNEVLNVTGLAEQHVSSDPTEAYVYGYDAVNRLTLGDYPPAFGLPADETFGYDSAGNRDDDPGSPTPWSYDANNRLVTSPSAALSCYDADGNLTTRRTGGNCTTGTISDTFTWDAVNRLRTFTTSGMVAGYAYDPFGRRIRKTVNKAPTWYVWDGDQLLAEYNSSGARQVRYAYSGGFDPAQMAKNNGAGEDVYDVHSDHLGTPKLLTDGGGGIAWRAAHDAFGKAALDAANIVTFNLRLPGQYFDAENELHYNRFRTYDPETGTYISADPVGQLGDSNLYRYVGNNPIISIDPLGLFDPYQFQPSGPVNSTLAFVQNYFTVGAPVNLGDSILGSAFESSASVRGEVSAFSSQLDRQAKDAAQAACNQCSGEGAETTGFESADSSTTDVRREPGLYSVGNSTFFRSGSCSVSVDCATGEYTYSCATNFGIRDAFTDPLEGRETLGRSYELPGGTPFPIMHSFSRSTSGAGQLK